MSSGKSPAVEVGGEIKIAVYLRLKKFLSSPDSVKEERFPASFRSHERAFVHEMARNSGMASKSRGVGSNRFVTVYKKNATSLAKDIVLKLTPESETIAAKVLAKNPLTAKEKQDLMPPQDRDRNPRSKLDLCRTSGKLSSGIPQIAPPMAFGSPGSSKLNVSLATMLELQNSLRSNNVNFVVCEADSSSRLIILADALLTTSAEDKMPMRIVATVNEVSNVIADKVAASRNENVGQTIGFQNRLESMVSPMTIMTVCNTEILLRSLMGNDTILANLTHLIVDGLDEPNRFGDMLLVILTQALARYKLNVIIVLSSLESVKLYRTQFPHANQIVLKTDPAFKKKKTSTLTNTKSNSLDLMMLCLYARLLAAPNFAIADFLARIPNPPSFHVTKATILALKEMEVLNAWEDVTEIGNHLLDWPLEPCYGKIVLYGVALKCLDPVLTIVSCLANLEPIFVGGDEADTLKNCIDFCEGTKSDHMVFLRAFQGWQKAKANGNEVSYCQSVNLSPSTLGEVSHFRAMLLGHLRASGFVRAKGHGDIKDLNGNSENWAVVKAALTAGCYPNLARFDQDSGSFQHKDGLYKAGSMSAVPLNADNDKNGECWFIFDKSNGNFVYNLTAITPATVLLFAGPNRLPFDWHDFATVKGQGQPLDYSDSENDEPEAGSSRDIVSLKFGDWINFQTDIDTARSISNLRQKWSVSFFRRLKTPGKPLNPDEENVIMDIIRLLTNEERAHGLTQPRGVGDWPKHT